MVRGQRQDSLEDQMRDVMRAVVEMGCYDAHDWLLRNYSRKASGDLRNDKKFSVTDVDGDTVTAWREAAGVVLEIGEEAMFLDRRQAGDLGLWIWGASLKRGDA